MLTQDLIIAAYRKLGFAAGETPSSSELADGLTALNTVLDSWSAQAVPIPQITRRTIALTAAASYTLTPRPIKIKGASVSASGMVVPVKLADAEEWAAGAGSQTFPALFHDGGYPVGNVYVRPAISGTLEYLAYEPLTESLGLSAFLDMPPGYERALIWEVALETAEEFGYPVTPNLVERAKDAKLAIAGLNAATLGPPVPVGPSSQA